MAYGEEHLCSFILICKSRFLSAVVQNNESSWNCISLHSLKELIKSISYDGRIVYPIS